MGNGLLFFFFFLILIKLIRLQDIWSRMFPHILELWGFTTSQCIKLSILNLKYEMHLGFGGSASIQNRRDGRS